ncbi:MAG: arsenate reductase ArsC [Leptospiraceae bacterium]|nr:arsenate reductase ArsC [Leptospiraceae bacterium]MCP5498932.1 arsenate reductase ArsC [Leptospiraceae bacterium]
MKNILVLCTGNSCRSQMAEGWLSHFAGGNATVYSAGIETHGVNPKAIYFMKEAGIDISGHTSNNVKEYIHIEFDFIITVCDHAKENCPYFSSKAKRFHYNFSDPSKVIGSEEAISDAFRKTRDEIKEYCRKFIMENVSNEK